MLNFFVIRWLRGHLFQVLEMDERTWFFSVTVFLLIGKLILLLLKSFEKMLTRVGDGIFFSHDIFRQMILLNRKKVPLI